MINILLLALLVSLCVVGLFSATKRGMILEHPACWLRKKLPMWLHKPICTCMICMSSFWSIIFAFVTWGTIMWYYLPILILAVAGLNTIFVALICHIFPNDDDEQEG